MNAIKTILGRSSSRTFRRSFALILVAEAVTICTAWLFLDSNVSRWISNKSVQLMQTTQAAAANRDWSLVVTLSKTKSSQLVTSYRETLKKLSAHYFPNKSGDLFIAVIEHGKEYLISPSDNPTDPMADNGKDQIDQWELSAYSSGKPTRTLTPQTDDTGTWLMAYTPILRSGKVVGLVGAEADSATVSDLQEIVRKTFWQSILPAILLSLIVAYVLAGMFVEPMDIFRRINETASVVAGAEKEDPLKQLTPREKEVAELVRRGLKNKEIADKLFVGPETVKSHLKRIYEKTGFNRVDLAVHAAAAQQPAPT